MLYYKYFIKVDIFLELLLKISRCRNEVGERGQSLQLSERKRKSLYPNFSISPDCSVWDIETISSNVSIKVFGLWEMNTDEKAEATVLGAEFYSLKLHVLKPQPQYFRMWLYLKIEPWKRSSR